METPAADPLRRARRLKLIIYIAVVLALAGWSVVGVWGRALWVEWVVWTAGSTTDEIVASLESHLDVADAPRLLPYLRSGNRARRTAVERLLLQRWWARFSSAYRAKLARLLAPVTARFRRHALADRPIRIEINPGGMPVIAGAPDAECLVRKIDLGDGRLVERFVFDADEGILEFPAPPPGQYTCHVQATWTPTPDASPAGIVLGPHVFNVGEQVPPDELQAVASPDIDAQMQRLFTLRIDRASRTPEGDVAIDVAIISTHNLLVNVPGRKDRLPLALTAVLSAEVDGKRYRLTEVYCRGGDPVARYWERLRLQGLRRVDALRLWLVLDPSLDVAYRHVDVRHWWNAAARYGPFTVGEFTSMTNREAETRPSRR